MRISHAATLLCSALVAFICTGPARAERGLVVGVAENGLKYEAPRTATAVRKLGAGGVRVTLHWTPGATDLDGDERLWMDRAVAAAGTDVRIILSVYGPAASAPQDAAARERYCAFVRSTLARYRVIRDVVIWNEPNKSGFWRPQFDSQDLSAAPAAYEALLARCYDVLHAFRADVNVISNTSSRGNDDPHAKSNISHSPGNFIRKMGEAYRASGRDRPIFDTVGHHPYPEHSAERPWRRHALSSTIGEGDWDKLVQAYHDAFAGTAQPNPGRCVAGRCAQIYYMEVGYQTSLDPTKARFYTGSENSETTVAPSGPGEPPDSRPDERSPAPDHGTQLADGIRLAYCQPYVGAYFNFLLQDEQDLAGWQSGVLWRDGTPKGSYAALEKAIADAKAGRVECRRYEELVVAAAPPVVSAPGQPTVAPAAFPSPRTDVPLLQLIWPKMRTFNWRNKLWRFQIRVGEDAVVTASLRRLGGPADRRRRTSKASAPLLAARGEVKIGYLSFVTFPRRRLPAGRYRFEVMVSSKANRARVLRFAGPAFRVRPRLHRRR